MDISFNPYYLTPILTPVGLKKKVNLTAHRSNEYDQLFYY